MVPVYQGSVISSLLGAHGTLLAHVPFAVCRDPKAPFSRAVPSQSVPCLICTRILWQLKNSGVPIFQCLQASLTLYVVALPSGENPRQETKAAYYLQYTSYDEQTTIVVTTDVAASRGGDERGLLSLAFHPNYKKNGKLYVSYTTNQERCAVDRHPTDININLTILCSDSNGKNRSSARILQIIKGKDYESPTEWLRLEGSSGGHLVQPPCSSGATYSQLPRTMSRQLLNISKDGDSTTSLGNLCQGSVTLIIRLLRAPSNLTLNVSRDGASATSSPGNLCQCLTTLIVNNFFLKSSLNLPSLSLKPLLLVLSQQALLKSLSQSFLQAPFKYWEAAAEQPQLSQPVFIGEVLQPSDHFHGPPLDLLQQLHVLLVLRAPELDAVLQGTVGLLGCERTLSAHIQLSVHQYTKSFSAGLLLITSSPSLCRTLHLALLNLMRFTQAHFSSLSRSLWMTSRPSGMSTAPLCLVLSENLLRVHLISLSMSLMKILNSTGPTVDCYPLDVTIQPIPYPLNSPPIKSVSLQFREKDVVPQVVTNLIFPYSGRGFTPLVPNMLSIDSGRVTCPCFHCLCSYLLLFSLTSMSPLIHAGLFPSLPDFLHLGTESSCALWKASLKICQLCSAPLSLRAVSQGVLLTNSLKSWKFAFLKFRVLTILLTCAISLRTVNSTNA
ncbi:hypothetical protein QYF61_017421 [Mycteria americana]|uniref:Uncharacterized protein n=1 Tax=Mycteria americana TaxID=33587 RepID=A0AAN7NVE5_MYCAM|nr:hypothetical protein QYF61_017421 [Mycteria americana]